MWLYYSVAKARALGVKCLGMEGKAGLAHWSVPSLKVAYTHNPTFAYLWQP